MPDPGKSNTTRSSDNVRFTSLSGIQAPEVSLRPLLRLRQLASEIQSAFRRDDMDIVGRASNLLVPTLAQWAKSRPIPKIGNTAEDAELTRLTQETQRALTECESLIQDAMVQNRAQSNLVRQHQQRVRRVRALRMPPRTGRVLDARR